MTDKELRRLSREDLLRLLLAQSREVNRQKSELESVGAERDELREALEQMKAKLDEKDEMLEKLNTELDEKEAELSFLREEKKQRAGAPAAHAEGIGTELGEALGAIEDKLQELSERIEKHDTENRHLWALLDAVMDQMVPTGEER